MIDFDRAMPYAEFALKAGKEFLEGKKAT